MAVSGYIGRFAPSPTGPLHAGSLVTALASWLDAKAHGGKWLVRIEDVDTPRCVPGVDQVILQQLAACGLHPDAPPVYQSQRGQLYQAALDQLIAPSIAYPCGCSRLDIEQAIAASGQQKMRHGELVYPGTCRQGLNGKQARSWRFATETYLPNVPLAPNKPASLVPDSIASSIHWVDRWLGPQSQNVAADVGDFVLKRADGLWAYQLAVVVDDTAQGVTHIVRGQDLADNTARQILLQRALGMPQPHYLHTPLVNGANGEKLSKQNGAEPLDTAHPIGLLQTAGEHLGLHTKTNCHQSTSQWLALATAMWRQR